MKVVTIKPLGLCTSADKCTTLILTSQLYAREYFLITKLLEKIQVSRNLFCFSLELLTIFEVLYKKF